MVNDFKSCNYVYQNYYYFLNLPGGKDRSFASEIGVNVAAVEGVVGCEEGGFGRIGVLFSELPLPEEMACKLAGRSTRGLLLLR